MFTLTTSNARFAAQSLSRTNTPAEARSNYFSYTQTIPSRFKKDIVSTANQENKTDTGVGLEGMQQVVANINMEHRMSRSERETIFCEIGGEEGANPAERYMNLI
jgi:hypothetical protein